MRRTVFDIYIGGGLLLLVGIAFLPCIFIISRTTWHLDHEKTRMVQAVVTRVEAGSSKAGRHMDVEYMFTTESGRTYQGKDRLSHRFVKNGERLICVRYVEEFPLINAVDNEFQSEREYYQVDALALFVLDAFFIFLGIRFIRYPRTILAATSAGGKARWLIAGQP